jgi:hypothetical protein
LHQEKLEKQLKKNGWCQGPIVTVGFKIFIIMDKFLSIEAMEERLEAALIEINIDKQS